MSQSLIKSTKLPDLHVNVTAKAIIMGAVASRDWQPQHHDALWATTRAGLPNIIMNNYTQAGWISRYVTDWSGPGGRIGRMRIAMRSPVCPGDELVIRGVLAQVDQATSDTTWVEIAVELAIQDRIATTATVRLALPADPGARSPWRFGGDDWRP